ncbi:hypothetical protein HD806DRAFT_512321 [Xylariaceae sp. AK1471]|nr:hypothetical protein HD806DRAFT_512321 [Xylariaceae sp. AK1471]
MIMESLVALDLAANVAQFTCMAGKAIKMTIELSKSKKSLTRSNEELDIIISDFKNIASDLGKACKGAKEDMTTQEHAKTVEVLLEEQTNASNPSIRRADPVTGILDQAMRISNEIETKLRKIKESRTSANRVTADKLHASFKELKYKPDLEELVSRLSKLRDQIALHISLILVDQNHTLRTMILEKNKAQHNFRASVLGNLENITKVLNEESRQTKPARHIKSWIQASKYLSEFTKDARKTIQILSSLKYYEIEQRHETIPEAHKSTFEWAFEPDATNLSAWLSSKEAIPYWISGNAGSGKSTLMKFVHTHCQTRKHLNLWAGKRRLHMVSHFFWSAGTHMQMSQEGLLRTVLFQILSQCPEWIPQVFPVRWNNLAGRTKSWTVKELLNALNSMPLSKTNSCLFLLIDGLDEYSGDKDILISLIRSVSQVSNLKICVSSRPWITFVDTFEGSPWTLRVQDLTKGDIRRYVQDNLTSSYRFKQLKSRNEIAARELVSEVTLRAQGVFLWVSLVVKSLARGLVNADSIGDLRRRLDELPPQLERFFERMLDSIDKFYKVRTARIFLILSHARSSFPLITFFFLDKEDGPIYIEPKTFLRDWPEVDDFDLDAIETKKRQLVAQCMDLIQITEHPQELAMFKHTVGFLHRTVYDYIRDPRVTDLLRTSAGTDFHPAASLFEAYFQQYQLLVHLSSHPFLMPHLRSWALACFYYAREIEVVADRAVAQSLNDMDGAFLGFWTFPSKLDAPKRLTSKLNLAIECGLYLYVQESTTTWPPKTRENILIQTLQPIQCIERDSQFRLASVSRTQRASRNPVDSLQTGSHNDTFSMFTFSEAETLLRFRQQSDNCNSQNPQPHTAPSVKQTAEQRSTVTHLSEVRPVRQDTSYNGSTRSRASKPRVLKRLRARFSNPTRFPNYKKESRS